MFCFGIDLGMFFSIAFGFDFGLLFGW